MAKHRIEVDVAFDSEDNAIALLNLIEQIKATTTDNPGVSDDLVLRQYCRYHKCFHDEIPTKPCGKYVYADFKNAVMEHKRTDGKVVTYNSVDTTIKVI